ncbi:MAG: HAD family phosphatase [Clostridiales bacterium]|nr:HAD family phosphatase [Clostridiales bacterium]
MIRTIVFDMGGVIIQYDPALYVRRVTKDPDEARILEDAVFHSQEWFRLDEGTIELEEFDQILKASLPGPLVDKGLYLLHHWYENMPVFSGIERLMAVLSASGIPLYLLSNAGQQFHTYKKGIPAFRYLKGIVLSSDLKLLKPGPEIYQYLLDTYELQPEEVLFIDDSPANVRGAEALGIRGYDYSDGILKHLLEYLVSEALLAPEAVDDIL